MFYGAQIKPGQTVSPSMEDGGEILHLSQICLVDPKDAEKTLVQINDGKNTFCVAVLQKDKCEHVPVDLFISTTSGVKLSTKGGKNEVHVVGYFEPEGPGHDDDDDFSDSSLMDEVTGNGKMEEDESDEDDDEDELNEKAKRQKIMQGNKAAKKKVALAKIEEADDDEEDEDEDEGEDEEEDSEDADEDEDEDEKETKKTGKQIAEKTKGSVGQNKQSNAAAQNSQTNAQNAQKRKLPNKSNEKLEKSDSKSGGDVTHENFQQELVKYLQANGRTNLGTLGQKVKKPANIDKLGHYLKDHSNVFKIENGFVSLVK